MIDLTTEFGARVVKRLETELIIWLTTVRGDEMPQPSPVWFHWDGAAFIIYSQPGKQKLRNIAGNPHVALHLDGDGRGGDIVIVSGRAELAGDAPPVHELGPYVRKYRDRMVAMGTAAEAFGQDYSEAIRVTPSTLRGF